MITIAPAQRIAKWFEAKTGQTLGQARLWRVETALTPLLRDNGLADLSALHSALLARAQPMLEASVIHSLMNHESFFFRDPTIFRLIEDDILPHLHATLPNRTLRIWSAGCSTGQEVYSLAMILARHQQMWADWRISIVGTDISPFAIETASRGLYPQMEIQRGMAIGDILRWFHPQGDHWQAAEELRAMTHFSTDDLLCPKAVSGHFDIILCRNVLLYLSADKRNAALRSIRRFTQPETILMLGAGETMIGLDSDFVHCTTFRNAYRQKAKNSYARSPASRIAC